MTVKFKDLAERMPKLLKDAIDKVTGKQKLDDLGEQLAKDIKKRTRVGTGVDKPGGNSKKFKKLSDSTKKSRGYSKRSGFLSSDTTPAKSNLTHSGTMVDSIHSTAKDSQVTIDVAADQADKVKYNADNGREFLHLSKAQVKKIEKDLEKELIETIEKALKKAL